MEGPPSSKKWGQVLSYLLAKGLHPDVPDIMGYTALDHATMNTNCKLDLARILLKAPNPANPNHQNLRGMVPLFLSMINNVVGAVDLLMEFGASLDIPDADGCVPSQMYVTFGPEVTATVRKWIRKRNGEEAPLDDKRCGNNLCPTSTVPEKKINLKYCSRCHTMRYCSIGCQRKHVLPSGLEYRVL